LQHRHCSRYKADVCDVLVLPREKEAGGQDECDESESRSCASRDMSGVMATRSLRDV